MGNPEPSELSPGQGQMERPEDSFEGDAREIACNAKAAAISFLSSPIPRETLIGRIGAELDHAYAKHGRDKWGRHEFYAILKEEVDELWEGIKSDGPQNETEHEALQVAAMVFRYLETGDRYRKSHDAREGNDAVEQGAPAQPSKSPSTPVTGIEVEIAEDILVQFKKWFGCSQFLPSEQQELKAIINASLERISGERKGSLEKC